MQQQETNQQQLHGLPSGVTWASSGMRQQAAESPAAAVPVTPVPPPAPSPPTNSVVDDNLWPSLTDSTASAAPTGKLKSDQEGIAGGRQGSKSNLGIWDRSGSGSGSTLEQMGGDPQMNSDQLLHLQGQQYHPLGSSGGGAQPQSRFTGQGQQQTPAPSTSYLPLGQPAGGVLEQFGGPRQHRATNGHVAATPAVLLDSPPSFNVFLNQAPQDAGGGSARLPPPKPPLAPTPPTMEALELAALAKLRANGKGPVPLIAAGKQPPPGFAGPSGGGGGSSNGSGSPRGNGFVSGTSVQQPLNMTSLVQQQQQSVSSSAPPLAVFPSRLLGPHISPLNNEDNPVVAGPFVARCRPISPPSASGTAYSGGSYVKPLPSLPSANPSASSMALRPQLWSGLPGIDLGPYNNLWQNAYQPTAYRPLIQQQQQQAPPAQQQQQQHAHYQPLLQLHLQQQQLLHQSPPQQQSHLVQGQASQLGGQGLSQMDPQVSYPMAGAPAKSPPPGFGPAIPPGGPDNGAAKQNGYRPYQLQLQHPARYNPLGMDPSAQPPQQQQQQQPPPQQQQPPQQQIPVHQVPGYRPQLSPA